MARCSFCGKAEDGVERLLQGGDADPVHVVVTLAQIHGLKVAAAGLLHTLGLGASKLQDALALEVALATFADENGITL